MARLPRGTKLIWVLLLAAVCCCMPAVAATTQVHIVKYAVDGMTVINETTVNYTWMEATLPVYGDGITHFYGQGPTFNDSDPYDPAEWQNVDTRDFGPVKGTDLKDLCELVGGMSPGDTIKIKAEDPFYRNFSYEAVYGTDPRKGPMLVTWYRADQGYVPAYSDGMRLVFFADNKTNTYGWNTSGWHVFGNWDMHETLPESDWYNFSAIWPSSGGLSVKYIAELFIYSSEPVPDTGVEVIYEGTVTLNAGNFTWMDDGGVGHEVSNLTPHGSLEAAFRQDGFTYGGSWHTGRNTALLDWVDDGSTNYTYIGSPKTTWNYQKNGVYQNYFSTTTGISNNNVGDGDFLEFYYGPDQQTTGNATAVLRIQVSTGETPPSDWTLSLKGARDQTVTKTSFEQGLACPSSGHMVNWTDSNGAVWSGVPLWLLVAMVDDNPDIGPDHFNFNDTLAAQGYSVKITAGDGFNTTLASADIGRDNGYIVANKLNGTDLPLLTSGGKLSWPLHLKGSAVFGGQQVGNITMIELTGMPQPPQGWTLIMEGDVVDVISQQYFEQAIVCYHNVTYTDSGGSIWTGVPLWDLAGAVDDIETSSHWTFNDSRANVTGYTVRVIAGDGYNRTFSSQNVSHNNGFIVANTLNGSPLSGSNGHLKLVGPSTTSGGQRVSNITKIRLEGLPSYPSGTYSLTLKGKINDGIPKPELEAWIAANTATYTDGSGNAYSGIALWRLLAWVDDRIPAGSNAFNDDVAATGYKVIVKAGDGYSKEFLSGAVARSNDYIVANTLNGSALPTDGSHPPWPLRLVGAGATGSNSVGNIAEIELTDFATVQTAAPVHIIKYGPDGITIINETNVTYSWMEANLDVIGDGTTVYKYEGITGNPSNIWDPEETYPGGFKIANAVKGTRVRDLCDLVGGMGTGTEIKFIASDNYETTLPYASIYTDPSVQARQGDAVVAWWADGQYVPYYADGIRLFFMPDDHIYGQWDMNQTLPQKYHHFYYQDNTFYPSCAGLSAKYVTTIKIYSEPSSDWTLDLDGRDIDGLQAMISRIYFEQALACQFGADHAVTYTDSSGRVWGGMPLWFLCGFVDDADQHSDNAYNETRALAGYNITITGTDGYNYTFDSRDTVRNANYLVANTLNGTPLPDSDPSWPLRLVGQNVTGAKVVKKIASISLVPFEAPVPVVFTIQAPAGSGGTITPAGLIEVPSGNNITFTIAPASGYTIQEVVVDGVGKGALPTYTFVNVTSNHTISASFGVAPTPIPTAVQPGTGGLYVISEPLATVIIDGKERGLSGRVIDQVQAGTRNVTLSAQGYKAVSFPVKINPARATVTAKIILEPDTTPTIPPTTVPTTVPTTMPTTIPTIIPPGPPVPTTGGLFVYSVPFGCSVSIDDVYRGTTPGLTNLLPPGPHELKLSRAGYTDQVRNFTITAGDVTTLMVIMTPDFGSIFSAFF